MLTDFGSLLVPDVALDDFIGRHYERVPLLIQRSSPGFYSELVTIREVSDYLSHSDVRHPGIRLVRSGDEIDPRTYTYSIPTTPTASTDGVADKEKVFRWFNEGYTLILVSYERHARGIFRLRHLAERTFHARVQANIYITPRNSQGFKAHWDNHDVFVLQFAGSKKWRLYDRRDPPPAKTELFEGEWTRVAPTLDVTLHDGDLLYIPKGYVHEASSTNTVSAHVTLGVTPYTYADLFRKLFDGIDSAPEFRASLPPAFGRVGVPAKDVEEKVRQFMARADVAAAVEQLFMQYASTRMPDVSDRLLDSIALPSLTYDTVLRKKQSLFVDVVVSERSVELRFNNKIVALPLAAHRCVNRILATETFSIETLDTGLDSESARVIVETLVTEGFLTIVG